MVGIVVTISPNLSLYNIVVLQAASRETNLKNTHLFLSKKPAEKLGEGQPHFVEYSR